jgi:hypothetical protein
MLNRSRQKISFHPQSLWNPKPLFLSAASRLGTRNILRTDPADRHINIF